MSTTMFDTDADQRRLSHVVSGRDMVSRLLPSSCTSSLWSLSPSILCEPVKYDTQILNEKIQNENIKQRKLLNVFASLR